LPVSPCPALLFRVGLGPSGRQNARFPVIFPVHGNLPGATAGWPASGPRSILAAAGSRPGNARSDR
jgi:hypothetical protein